MSVGCGCWSSPVPTSRALWEHWPEVLSLWAWVSSGQMEREELHPQGTLGSGESLELPPSPLTSSRWGPWCLMTSQCGSAEGHLQGSRFLRGTAQQSCPKGSMGKSNAAGILLLSRGIRHVLGSTGTACGGFGCRCCHLLCHLWCSSAE